MTFCFKNLQQFTHFAALAKNQQQAPKFLTPKMANKQKNELVVVVIFFYISKQYV